MATRSVFASAVFSYFTGDDDGLEEIFFAGSDDDLAWRMSCRRMSPTMNSKDAMVINMQ